MGGMLPRPQQTANVQVVEFAATAPSSAQKRHGSSSPQHVCAGRRAHLREEVLNCAWYGFRAVFATGMRPIPIPR